MSGICPKHRHYVSTCKGCNFPNYIEWEEELKRIQLRNTTAVCQGCLRKKGLPRIYHDKIVGEFCDMCWINTYRILVMEDRENNIEEDYYTD